MSASGVSGRSYGPAVIESAETPTGAPPGSRLAYGVATVIVAARWLIVIGWVAAAVLAVLLLPPLAAQSGGIGDITSSDNPAIIAEIRAAQAFGFPVLSRTMLVQHDPGGLPQGTVEKAY